MHLSPDHIPQSAVCKLCGHNVFHHARKRLTSASFLQGAIPYNCNDTSHVKQAGIELPSLVTHVKDLLGSFLEPAAEAVFSGCLTALVSFFMVFIVTTGSRARGRLNITADC